MKIIIPLTLAFAGVWFTPSANCAPNPYPFAIPKTYPGFNRTCSRSTDCNFKPTTSSEKVWLLCEDRACICDRNIYIAYAKSWGLRWDGKQCTIGKNGPCGESDGLTIGCQDGLTCNIDTRRCQKNTAVTEEILTTSDATTFATTTTSETTITPPTTTMAVTVTVNLTVNILPVAHPKLDQMREIDPPIEVAASENIASAIALTAATETNAFSRFCERSTDCQFKPTQLSDRIWLACENSICSCSRFHNLADVKDFDVSWNGTDCTVGLGGPCGDDNGIKISCQEKYHCSEQKCLAIPHSIQLDEMCAEDVDCAVGLLCKVAGFRFHPIKHCVH